MHLQDKANNGFLPKNIDLEKIKPSTKWKNVQNTFGNESNIKISFIRQLLKEIEDSNNKISIFIGESPVVGEPDYEVSRTRMEFEKNIIEELEKNNFITNQHTTRKSTDKGHYEDTIYVNFEIIKKDIVKYLRSLLMKILKKEEESKKLQKKKENIKYFIKLSNQAVILNNKYIIKKTDFNSVNSNFFEYAYNHSGEKILKKDLKIDTGIDFPPTKQLRHIVNEIGFKGELKKMFFSDVSKTAIIFNNYISEDDLDRKNINIKELNTQIKGLKSKV